MIELGRMCELKIIKIVRSGMYLDGGHLGEVILPARYMPPDMSTVDTIEVFIYLDSDGRTVATTQPPMAQAGEFAYLKVAAITRVGAFLDWGLDKDLLVPFAEQQRPMEYGEAYLVYIYLDSLNGRITASSKIDTFLDDERPHDFQPKQPVNLIIAQSTDLGYKAIVDHSHWGLLYKNEVFERLSFGQKKQGYIKSIRPDGKIDLTLHGGSESRDKHADLIVRYLEENDGFAPVHDKSDPQQISTLFGMSKKAYKRTIGNLYKQRIIRIEDKGICLVKK